MDDVTAFEILAVPAVQRGTFRFDDVRYDVEADAIHLASGPGAACMTERSPEGFEMRIDPLENRIVGITIDGVRERVLATGGEPIKVTIGRGQRLGFDPTDLRRIIFGGRFSRGAAADERGHRKAATAKRRFQP